MTERPNLDYESAPDHTSFSRLGPPAPRVEPFHYEVAEELEPAPQASNRPPLRLAKRRTGSRRRYGPKSE